MKIKALTTFLDGRDRFEKGDIRTVDDEAGARFVANGWVANMGCNSTDLDIQNGQLGMGDSNG